MKQSDIKVGKTYINKNAGKTRRTVLAIGMEHRPNVWYSDSDPPLHQPGVLYVQDGVEGKLFLGMFTRWCGKEVE